MVFNALKSLFSTSSKDDKARMPREFLSIRWSEAAQQEGVGGERNKRIHHIKEGRSINSWRYSNAILEAFQDERKLPVIDETGGKPIPQPDNLITYQPNILAKDQRNIQQLKDLQARR